MVKTPTVKHLNYSLVWLFISEPILQLGTLEKEKEKLLYNEKKDIQKDT